MGAVISDAAAWVSGGIDAQAVYLEERKAEHVKIDTFNQSGYEGCFHDGVNRLLAVEKKHSLLRKSLDADGVTPHVLDLALNKMLLGNSRERLRARQITEMFERILQSARESLLSTPAGWSLSHSAPPSTVATTPTSTPMWSPRPEFLMDSERSGFTPSPSPPTAMTAMELQVNGCTMRPSLRSTPKIEGHAQLCGSISSSTELNDYQKSSARPPSLSSERVTVDTSAGANGRRSGATISPLADMGENITIHQLDEYRVAKKNGQPVDPEIDRFVELLEHNLPDRDQFFFIDDSATMLEHQKIIVQGFKALSWIAKRLDPNKVELSFASCPTRIFKTKKTRKLTEHVSTHQYRWRSNFMEKQLDHLFKDIIRRLPYEVLGFNINPCARKEISIYIFTDGVWGDDPDAACGVEKPLRRLIDELKVRRLARNQVSLHFVRFGNSATGKRHLEFLDNFGRKEGWYVVPATPDQPQAGL
jgi:hypothetical protein